MAMRKLFSLCLFLILSAPLWAQAQDYHLFTDQTLFNQKIENMNFYASGVATCLAVSIYDPNSGYVFMAHISATYDTEQLVTNAVKSFADKGIGTESLIANIGGGWLNRSEPYFEELANSLTKRNIRYEQVGRFADVGDSHNGLNPVILSEVKDRASRDFKFDFETGKLIEMTDPAHYEIWE